MSTWVDEYHALKSPDKLDAKLGFKNLNNKAQPTKAEKLEAELKLLEWHKLANNSAMKVISTTIRFINGLLIHYFLRYHYYRTKP